MKKQIKIVAILLSVICALPLFAACEKKPQKEERSRYEITATYDEENKTVTASMSLSYYNGTEAILDELCFHLYPAAFREGARFSPVPKDAVSSAYPAGLSYGGIEIGKTTLGGAEVATAIEGEDEDILVVKMSGEGLYPTERAELTVDFTLTLPEIRHRFGYQGTRVNLGNWYPIACAFEDGNFVTDPYYSTGDPFYSDCADYKVSVTVPDGLTVAASGRVTGADNADGTKTFSSEILAARDYAAVIGEFKMLGSKAGDTDVNYYYISDPEPEKALTAAVDAVKTFSDKFGEYPYESMSSVETQFLQGGMEYPGLAMISDALTGDIYREAIIHETAHQWWYAAVGNDEVRYPWLDEGLTEFSTSIFYRENPAYEVDYEKRIADALGAYVLYFDAFGNADSDTSMTRKVCEYDSAFEYTYMTYVKGELMFESLRSILGDEKFFAGLKDYYSTYKFKTAKPDDLIGCMEKASGRDLKGFFDSWTEGKVADFGGLSGK